MSYSENKELQGKVQRYKDDLVSVNRELTSAVNLYNSQVRKIKEVRQEHDLAIKAKQALKDVAPLLSISAMDKAEKLANSAIAAIFDFPAKLVYDRDEGRFVIQTPEGNADLQEGTGGGLQAVVSFVFQVFLLMKENARMFIALDEAWTQLSDEALLRFIEFVNQLCADMKLDICLITHDARITPEMVKHMYRIEGGRSVKLK